MEHPQKYHLEADRLREQAQATGDPEIRAQLLNIANQYDLLAELIEARGTGPAGVTAPATRA
ncbi:MAG: hypothetical protein JWL84_739 [Rhodospirillales bacterium]|nr:hypothetical protein [Rhodospirillales bacterium]